MIFNIFFLALDYPSLYLSHHPDRIHFKKSFKTVPGWAPGRLSHVRKPVRGCPRHKLLAGCPRHELLAGWSTCKPVGAVPGISSWRAVPGISSWPAVPHDKASPYHISLSFHLIIMCWFHQSILSCIMINSDMSYPYNHAINLWYIYIDITYSCSKSNNSISDIINSSISNPTMQNQ